MPKIEKVFTLEVNPEQFLKACSQIELIELDVLLASPRYQNMMKTGKPEGWTEEEQLEINRQRDLVKKGLPVNPPKPKGDAPRG